MNRRPDSLRAGNMTNAAKQHEPVTVSLEVVWQGTSVKQNARMSEISMDGCFIDSRVQGRALGDIVEFKVHLPSGPWVSLRGELINEDYPMGFGLRFRGLSDRDKRLLAQVVAAHGGDPGDVPPAHAAVAVQTPAQQVLVEQRSVLIADDDPLTLWMVTAIAEMEGFRVKSAPDGRQALQILQQETEFSAAIFDMRMPHLQGLDLIRYMKADERWRQIPVGMITGDRDPKVWDDSVAAGACVFLPKPFTAPQMQMMLLMLTSKAG